MPEALGRGVSRNILDSVVDVTHGVDQNEFSEMVVMMPHDVSDEADKNGGSATDNHPDLNRVAVDVVKVDAFLATLKEANPLDLNHVAIDVVRLDAFLAALKEATPNK